MQDEYLQSLVDSAPENLKKHLVNTLRPTDEAVLLPGSALSCESGEIKRVCLILDGKIPNPPAGLFSKNWYTGISVVSIPSSSPIAFLSSVSERKDMLKRLASAVRSEVQDPDFSAGAEFLSENGSDLTEWQAGFDGPGCCVGLYSALHSTKPFGDAATEGMRRPVEQLFLVAKAGPGGCGQTFHARLIDAVRQGASLNDALAEGGSPGAEAKKRVEMSSKRNRGRLLAVAAKTFGLTSVNLVSDYMSVPGSDTMLAVADYEVECNTLEPCQESSLHESAWAYGAGCVDCTKSNGIVVCKNAADGFLIFEGREKESGMAMNRLHNCVPFGTPRALSNRDAVAQAVQYCQKTSSRWHPDQEWLGERFVWTSKEMGSNSQRVAPPPLWGSHSSECHLGPHGKELGLSHLLSISLKPELVCISGVETGKLRTAVTALSS